MLKIFIGCDPNNCDLEQMMVLDYSIHKHTSQPCDITWLQLSHDPASPFYSDPASGKGWRTERWATPFSGLRWAIPELCGFEGRAIYFDADVVVLSDLAELWQHPFDKGSFLLAKSREMHTRLGTCVFDCVAAKKRIPALKKLQKDPRADKKMKRKLKKKPAYITEYQDTTYNCIDGEGVAAENMKILHYSDMGTQFSHRYSIPRIEKEGGKHWFDGTIYPHPRPDLAALFDQYYQEALDNGYKLDDYRCEPFGSFPKKSQKAYKGNHVTRVDGTPTNVSDA